MMPASTLLLARRVALSARAFRRAPSLLNQKWFSTSQDEEQEEVFPFSQEELPNKQDFVKVKLEPGEWDTDRTDPITKPPWKNKARIISKEDFANRPRAGFNDEFASPYDAMLILSWLDREQQDKIYQSYLNFMKMMEEKESKTSHEYAIRVIAQKYNLQHSRVAAVVQLLHNEDQIRKHHPEQEIHYDLQDYVDARVKEHITNAYDAFGQEPPDGFVETPMAVSGLGDIDRNRAGTKEAGDDLDVDDLMEKALIREQREARAWIDNYVYVEDVDEDTVKVKVTGDCHKLMKAQERLKEKATARPEGASPLPEGGEVRPRWKFMAETINTRELSKKKYYRPRKGKMIKNAIVEENGHLRVASVAELKKTCWKPERHTTEFTYQYAKQGWLDRTLNGSTDSWGRVERPVEEAKEETKEAKAVDGGDAADDGNKEAPKESESTDESEADSKESAEDSKLVQSESSEKEDDGPNDSK